MSAAPAKPIASHPRSSRLGSNPAPPPNLVKHRQFEWRTKMYFSRQLRARPACNHEQNRAMPHGTLLALSDGGGARSVVTFASGENRSAVLRGFTIRTD